jgi:hypothetical protein
MGNRARPDNFGCDKESVMIDDERKHANDNGECRGCVLNDDQVITSLEKSMVENADVWRELANKRKVKMNITENQRYFADSAVIHPEIVQYIDGFWVLYDRLRDAGELLKIEGNPHIETDFLKLVGYPFAVRTGLEEMQTDMDGVIEKLDDETMSPWMP